MNARFALFASLALAIAGAACGGGQTEPKAPEAAPAPGAPEGAAGAPAAAGPVAPAKPWTEMKPEERLALMKTTVRPTMAAEFQAVDAADFKDFNCTTCHGPGAKQGNFKMPNPLLPKLDVKDGFKKHMTEKPAITKFMMEKVVPDMAKMLGVAPYDPATHKGFGCGNCHTME
jgi:hypothetical protein